MATLARANRELEAAYKEALEQLGIASECLDVALDEIWSLQMVEMTHLRDQFDVANLQRVAAQRGLVNYMREHGLGDRIGYDPDADPAVQQAIAEGKIPPRGVPLKVQLALPDKASPPLAGMPRRKRQPSRRAMG